MIKVAVYCRVSTDREDQSNSFESQQSYFRAYIQGHSDWELFGIYADEGISGTNTKKRVQFNRMINDAYEGRFRLIITKEVSRFSRNILDTIAYTRELRNIGVGVIFANDRINTLEPESEMLLSFLASLAQEESRRISSRVVWGQTRQMEKGIVFGKSLLGYDVKDGILSINEKGAKVVRLIFHMYAIEQVGTSEIARFLTNHRYCTRSGREVWSSTGIVKILNNEKYVGDLIQKKSYTPDYLTHSKRANKGQVPIVMFENHHEAIISREVWNMAQERLRRNNKHTQCNCGHSNRYVFSGKIKCGECGSSFVGRFKYLKDGTSVRRWSCATAAGKGAIRCGVGKLVRDDDAMQMLKTAINSLQLDYRAVVCNLTDLAVRAIRAVECDIVVDVKRMHNEIERLQRKIEVVMDSYFSGEITLAEMQNMKQRYDGQIETLRQRYNEAECLVQRNCTEEKLRDQIYLDVLRILQCEVDSDVFYKTLLDSLTVFQDRHMELKLKQLPYVYIFSG